MEKILVTLLVLILELNCLFGLYIVNSEVDNKTDVYEVHEDEATKSLTFINPKSERPILREIIYFHVIETPYGQEEVISEHLIDSEEIKNGKESAIDNENVLDNAPLIDNASLIDNEPLIGNADTILNINGNESAIDNENVLDSASLIGNASLIDNADIIDNENITNNENVIVNKSITGNTIAISNEPTVSNEKVINELIIGNEDISTGHAIIEKQGSNIDFEDGPRHFTNGQGFQYFNDPETPEHGADAEIPITVLKPAVDTASSDENTTTYTNLDEEHLDEEMNTIVNDTIANEAVINDYQVIDPIEADANPDPDNTSNIKEHDDKDTSKTKRQKRETDYSETANEEPSININIEKLEDQITELEDNVGEIAVGEERSVKKRPKTYGIKLTGDVGVVWNNINDLKVSHAVGATNNEIENRKDKRGIRAGKSEEGLSRNAKFDHGVVKQGDNDTSIEEPRKSGKTYGMSLTGDHGTVWNDLNGVLYQVGEPNKESDELEKNAEDSTEDDVAETSTKPNLNDILDDILKPSDETDEDKDLSNEINDAFTEIDDILNEITKETEDPKNNTNDKTVDDIIDIIKEVLKNETTKLEDKVGNLNISEGNDEDKNENLNIDDNTGDDDDDDDDENPIDKDDANKEDNNDNDNEDPDEALELPDVIKTLMNNEPFWRWINDWASTYVDLLMTHLDDKIKAEVTKQIQEYNATHAHDKESSCNDRDNHISEENIDDGVPNNNADNEIKEDIDGAEEEPSSKKRKDKDSEDKNGKKEDPVNIQANNVYGNSVGNGKVTNIFIYNIRKKSDLDNIRPIHNGTNGIYVFGNDGKIPDDDEDKIEGNKDPAKDETSTESLINSPDSIEKEELTTEKVTIKPDNGSEQPVGGINPDEVTENSKVTTDPESAESKDNDAAEISDVEATKPDSNESSDNVPEDPDMDDRTAEKETSEPDVEEQSNVTTEGLNELEESATSAPENEDSKETEKADSDGTQSDDESKEDTSSNSKRNEDETTQSPDTEVNNKNARNDTKKEKLRIAKHTTYKKTKKQVGNKESIATDNIGSLFKGKIDVNTLVGSAGLGLNIL